MELIKKRTAHNFCAYSYHVQDCLGTANAFDSAHGHILPVGVTHVFKGLCFAHKVAQSPGNTCWPATLRTACMEIPQL